MFYLVSFNEMWNNDTQLGYLLLPVDVNQNRLSSGMFVTKTQYEEHI